MWRYRILTRRAISSLAQVDARIAALDGALAQERARSDGLQRELDAAREHAARFARYLGDTNPRLEMLRDARSGALYHVGCHSADDDDGLGRYGDTRFRASARHELSAADIAVEKRASTMRTAIVHKGSATCVDRRMARQLHFHAGA